MGTTMRHDFAEHGAWLPMPAQRKNLQRIHDELVDKRHILELERVLAVMNYQQGSFLRLPTHILVLTMARLTYTHDGGIRSVPVEHVDFAGVRHSNGIANGDLVVPLLTGERLSFHKGASLSVLEMAQALQTLGLAGGSDVPTPVDLLQEGWASQTRPAAEPDDDDDDDEVGDGLLEQVASVPAGAQGAQDVTPPIPRPAQFTGQRAVTPVVMAKPAPGSIYQLAVEAAATDDPFNVERGEDADRWISTVHDPDCIYVIAPPAVFTAAVDWPWEVTPGIEGTGSWESVVPFAEGFDVAAGFVGVAGALLGPGLWHASDSGHAGVWTREGSIWSETPTAHRAPREGFAR